ncbi:MAG TPA: prepilin-type N-terminal cleavage/methylation domain-containing protein [Candidatus Paceibacterota bacterium]|nr:prepilin-type N-terminal cleavage/methylation domain-containing protein [Candidatus Paceibacterota bacterium]
MSQNLFKNFFTYKRGFTLIEILIVIGIIAILAAVVIVAINPSRQFAQAHNSQRLSNINSVLNAVGQNIADNKGVFMCSGVAAYFTNSPMIIKTGAALDLRKCLVPTYLSEMGVDPTVGSNTCVDSTPGDCASGSYNTGYAIATTSANRYIVSAPGAELGATTTVTR